MRSRGSRPARARARAIAAAPRLTEPAQAACGHYVERLGGRPRPMADNCANALRSHRVTVAVRSGQIAGMIVPGIGTGGFLVGNVAVDPSHQGSGIGRVLLEHAEHEARRAGCDSISLYTHERMAENLAFYSRIGYVEYDRRVHGEALLVYLRERLA